MQSFVPENCYNYNINSKVVQLIPKFNLDTIYLYLSTDWQCLLYAVPLLRPTCSVLIRWQLSKLSEFFGPEKTITISALHGFWCPVNEFLLRLEW